VEDNFRQLSGATDFKVLLWHSRQHSGGLLSLTECLQDRPSLPRLRECLNP
jgi:hypothetical protein